MIKPEPYWNDMAIITGQICPYCNVSTELVDETEIYGEILYGRKYLRCKVNRDHYVGCYRSKEVKSLGRISNADLRALKVKCHVVFDRSWRDAIDSNPHARILAYKWLSDTFEIPFEYCHFGMMDEAWCLYILSSFESELPMQFV
jgi:hypothetical protein